MSGITPLVDTLLATRLAQRLDLVPLKGQFDITGPVTVNPVGQVTNDVRLSSRAAAQQQLGGVLPQYADTARPVPTAGLNQTVTLSAMARALTAILDPPAATPTRIFGTAPLVSDAQTPNTPQLTATLANTVAHSGLFYEAHLRQFAVGTRTQAQLAQEPQAQLQTRVAFAPDSHTQAPMPGQAEAVNLATLPLVRQQLELLAAPQFRWTGEAWSGVVMDWDVEPDPDASPAADAAPAPTRWRTRLALNLPTLGAVEFRLQLAGNTLQLRVVAQEQATVGLLDAAGAELPGRLGAQGLQLTSLFIGAQGTAAGPAS